jgi:hypothetical protein
MEAKLCPSSGSKSTVYPQSGIVQATEHLWAHIRRL